MKKSLIILFLGSIIGFLGTGCKDFLEADNKSKVADVDYLTTKEGFETLVNQAYFTLREVYDDQVMYSAGTDLYIGIRSTGDPAFESYAITSDNDIILEFYIDLFSAVNAANAVLYYAGYCEDFEEKALRLEEARFLRAYSYYILSQQFGGVPILEEFINTAETSYPRNTLEETYQFMISELDELSKSTLLPAVDVTGRVSTQAAKALLAKVYLAAGWDLETTLNDDKTGAYTVTGTSYFELAASTAASVADGVALTMPFEEKWSPFNEQNPEAIFSVQWDRATMLDVQQGGYSHQNNFGTYLGAVVQGLKFVESEYNITSKTFHLFERGDERYNASFMTTVLNATESAEEDTWKKEGYWAYYNASSGAQETMGIAYYFPAWYTTNDEIDAYLASNADRFVSEGLSNVTKIVRNSDPMRWIEYNRDGTLKSDDSGLNYNQGLMNVGAIPTVKKFDDPETSLFAATSDGSYRNLVVLNISDIYLVAAEAYLMANNQNDALRYLNAVRSRSGADEIASFASYQRYDPLQGYVSADKEIDVVLDERARELLGEYYRWMDLRRTKQLVRYNMEWNINFDVNNIIGGDGKYKWLRPIPAAEISLNDGIEPSDQNPGYTAETSDEASDE